MIMAKPTPLARGAQRQSWRGLDLVSSEHLVKEIQIHVLVAQYSACMYRVKERREFQLLPGVLAHGRLHIVHGLPHEDE